MQTTLKSLMMVNGKQMFFIELPHTAIATLGLKTGDSLDIDVAMTHDSLIIHKKEVK